MSKISVPLNCEYRERHATLDYPESNGSDEYSDCFGFNFDDIDSIDAETRAERLLEGHLKLLESDTVSRG